MTPKIETNKQETPEPITARFEAAHLAALEVFMARDDIRYYLNGICVQPCAEGGALLIATNGSKMLVIRDKDGFASRQFIIPNMPQVLGICRTKRPKKAKSLAEIPTTVIIESNRLNIINGSYKDQVTGNSLGDYQSHLHSAWPFKEIEGKYPDIERVIPRHTTPAPASAVSVNSKYLGDLHKAMARLCPSLIYATTLIQRGENDPLVFLVTAPDVEAFAIIMPMRIGSENSPAVPSWAFSTPAPEESKETAEAA